MSVVYLSQPIYPRKPGRPHYHWVPMGIGAKRRRTCEVVVEKDSAHFHCVGPDNLFDQPHYPVQVTSTLDLSTRHRHVVDLEELERAYGHNTVS